MALLASYFKLETVEQLEILTSKDAQLLNRPDFSYWINKMVLVLSGGFSYFILFFILQT